MKKALLTALSGLLLISCTAAPNHALAQAKTDVPVLVLGEDSDPKSVKRSSDIFRRVITEIQSQVSAYNFDVKDEHAVGATMDWQFKDRRPKQELFEVAKLANSSGNPSVYSRALVTFKIMAAAKDVGFAKKAQVRIAGEVYDVEANRFLGAWEAPTMTFPAPKDCDGVCIHEVVGNNARDMAAAVGDVIRKKLAYMARGEVSGNAASGMGGSNGNLETTYAFTFRNFAPSETHEITSVMEKEFPEYIRTLPPQGSGPVLKYGYVSRAPQHKIQKWMNILLADMGLDPDTKVNVTMQGTAITIDKIVGGPVKTAPASGSRFK